MNETNDFGLSADSIEWIKRALRVFPEIEEAIIFGSRAKGTEKPGSDIDFAMKGNFPSYNFMEKIRTMLTDGLMLPYFFDVLEYDKISNPDLKEHIDRVGRVFYRKGG